MPYNQFAAVGEEVNWGVPVARNKMARVHEGNALDHDIDQDVSSIMSSNVGGDAESMFVKGESGSGTIIIPSAFDDGFRLKIMKHGIGSVSTQANTPSAGYHTHTFMRRLGPPFIGGAVPNAMGLSLETNYELPDGTPASPLQARLVEGAVVNTLEWGWQAQEECKCAAGILGEQMTQIGETASPVFADLDNYLQKYSQAGIKIDGGGELAPIVLGVSLKIENNFTTIFTLGSSTTRQPRRKGKAKITGTLKVLWDQTQLPTTQATNAGTASTALTVAAAIFANGDTIKLPGVPATVVSAGGGTTSLTLGVARTWTLGATVAMNASSASGAGVASTALTITQALFQTGDYITIGGNTPVFVTAGGGTTSLTISAAQSWSSGATVQMVSSAAKYLWDKFKSKTPASFIVSVLGTGSYSETATISNVRLGKPTLSPEEGQTQSAEFPFWALNDLTNSALKVIVVNQNASV